MLHHVRGVPEDRSPDVSFDEERVSLGPPHRPAVPSVEAARGGKAQDPYGQHGEACETDELERTREAARPRRRERCERRAPGSQGEPRDEQREGDEHARRERSDVDSDHRAEARGESARCDAGRGREAGDRREPAPPRRDPREEDDVDPDCRHRGIERDEPHGIDRHRRCPSQTPATTPISSKLSRTDGSGSPNTITASACAGSDVAIAG